MKAAQTERRKRSVAAVRWGAQPMGLTVLQASGRRLGCPSWRGGFLKGRRWKVRYKVSMACTDALPARTRVQQVPSSCRHTRHGCLLPTVERGRCQAPAQWWGARISSHALARGLMAAQHDLGKQRVGRASSSLPCAAHRSARLGKASVPAQLSGSEPVMGVSEM